MILPLRLQKKWFYNRLCLNNSNSNKLLLNRIQFVKKFAQQSDSCFKKLIEFLQNVTAYIHFENKLYEYITNLVWCLLIRESSKYTNTYNKILLLNRVTLILQQNQPQKYVLKHFFLCFYVPLYNFWPLYKSNALRDTPSLTIHQLYYCSSYYSDNKLRLERFGIAVPLLWGSNCKP